MIARRPDEPPVVVHWSSLLLLAGEMTWLCVLGWSGWRLGGGWWPGAVEGAVFIGAFVLTWGTWMAPRARRRLDFEGRQLVLVLMGSLITVLGAAAGALVPALAASVAVVVGHRRHYRVVRGGDADELADRSPGT